MINNAAANDTFITVAGTYFFQAIGVDMQPVIWAAIGAATMLAFSNEQAGRWRAIAQIISSAFLGGLIGLVAANISHIDYRPAALLLAAIGGAGAYPICNAAIRKFVARVEQ